MVSARSTLAGELAGWALALDAADVPGDVVELTKLRLLDTLGLILAAWELPEAISVRAVYERQGGRPEARLLAGGTLPAPSAALVHGTLAHALDYDDTLLDSLVHASSVVFPTVLAVGDAPGTAGAEAVTAAAAAYEVAARLGAAAGRRFHERGYHATGVLGPLFAAVAAARLERLTQAESIAAIGIAGSTGAGLLEFLSDGTSTKRLHPGWAARAGIDSVRLAAAGFTGPASVLEGRFGVFASHIGAPPGHEVVAELGDRWLSRDASFKRYPCAHVLHPYIDGALALRGAARIMRIVATMPDLEVGLFARPADVKAAPRTEYESRTSLPYVLAAACFDGHVDLDTFAEPAFARPEVRKLAEAVDVVVGERRWLVVELADGTRLDTEAQQTVAGRDSVLEKFEQNAAALLPDDAVARVRDAVLALEARPLAEVIDAVRSGR